MRLLVMGFAVLSLTGTVRAQEAVEEAPDATRLDVERLPVEAIEVTRALYAHGWFVEGVIGGRGFRQGVGRYSKPGLFVNLGVGYEIASWLWVKVGAEGSIHETRGPSPPSPTAFEFAGAVGEVRFQWNTGSRTALWLGGEGGLMIATGDVLPTYGFQAADGVLWMYGGTLGFDGHMLDRHRSLGVLAGARWVPGLDGFDGPSSFEIHAGAYLRHVF